jgi:hypothetical protein
MSRPDLPGQEIEVPDQAVPHYQSAGWAQTTPPPAPPRPPRKEAQAVVADEDSPAVVAEETAEPAPEKTARRRTPKEGETT